MAPKIYLDYAATTPVDSVVLAAMEPYFNKRFGNAGSLHSFGQEAMATVDESREKIAKAIDADFREVIFTGSATEANNLALRGIIKASGIEKPKIITSTIEHESILETCRDLEREGAEVIYSPVNKDGVVNLSKLKSSLNNRTILVSIMAANNEIGTIEPIDKIERIIREFKGKNNSIYPLFHTDAVQAFQYLDCDVKKLGVDLITLSAHKIYGPKGVGALYIRNSKHEARNPKQISNLKSQNPNKNVSNFEFRIPNLPAVLPLVTGGGQELGLRSGTENIPSIVGFAKAVEMAIGVRKKETKRVPGLRDYFWNQIKKISPKAKLNGPAIKNFRTNSGYSSTFTDWGRLPNNLNIYFPNKKAEDLLIKLDLAGVAVSAGSACSARGTEPSHVLKACGFPLERIKSSLRITLGRPTTKEEIDEAITRIRKILIDTN